MKRHPNQITISNLKKFTYPDTIIFVDCETRQDKSVDGIIHHRLWFGCVLIWRIEKTGRKETIVEMSFSTARQFWHIVNDEIQEKQGVYLFAHNLKFDFMVLDGFRLLPEMGFTLQSIYHKFTTSVMKFRNGNRLIQIADSMNYYQTSLEKLAPMVGEQKIAVDFDRPNKKEIMRRCASDVRIIYKAIKLIVDKLQSENLGGFKITAPSISFSIFRSRFMNTDIITHHNDKMVQLERDGYYGGFVQVFKLFEQGQPNLYKLDINAMYPSVMKGNHYPIRMNDVMQYPSLWKMSKLLNYYLATARVTIETDEPCYPYRYTSGIYYPIGRFETVLTTPSLLYALEHGHIKEVHTLVTYLKSTIFDDYIDYMYSQRLAAKHAKDLPSEMFYKIMMNSLYGKFGQTSTENKIIGSCNPDVFESYHGMNVTTKETFREIFAGGSVIQIHESGESRYTFYTIAAHVTDYARMKLFELIRRAGRNNVFYSDTDSLIVNETGYKKLVKEIHPEKLGKLKIEDTGNVFIGFAKKDYLLGDKRKLKGFTRTPMEGNPHLFKSFQSSSFYGAMTRKEISGSYWRVIEKIHNPYVKGVHVKLDGSILPYRLGDDMSLNDERIYTIDIIKDIIKQYATKDVRRSLKKWI